MSNSVTYIIELKQKFAKAAAIVKKNVSDIDRKVKKANESMKKWVFTMDTKFLKSARKMRNAGAVMTAAVSLPVLLIGKRMVDAASDAEETANKFNEVFKGIETKSFAAVSELTKGYKLASSTSQELLSDTGDLLVGLGLTREKALELSLGVVKLSADVASFKNVQGGTARASMALTKALLGEREMLKETFKTALLESEVKARAAIIKKNDTSLTERQAKALATLAIVTERNKDAIGDLARTQDAYANIQRESAENSKELAESFGKLLLPIAVKIQRVLIKITNKLNSLSPGMKKFILILAAVAAVVGPLLVIFGGLVLAIGALSLPVVLVIAAISALAVGVAFLATHWDETVEFMKNKWKQFKEFIIETAKSAFSIVIKIMDAITLPMRTIVEKFGGLLGFDFKMPGLAESLNLGKGETVKSPSNPVPPSGTLSGNIIVSAEEGTKVNKTTFRARGRGLNLGMNMEDSQ